MKHATGCQIGEAAKRTGSSVHTIRYYGKIGLMKKLSRSAGGFGVYSPDTSERILFIKKAQSFGLTLGEIKKNAA